MCDSQFQDYIDTITSAFENVNINGKYQIDPNFFVFISTHPYYRALCRLQSIKKSEESTKLYAEDALSMFDDFESSNDSEESKENEATHNYDISSVDYSNWQQNTELYPYDYVASFENYNPYEDENFMDQVKDSLNDLNDSRLGIIKFNKTKQFQPFINEKGKKMIKYVRKSGIITYREIGDLKKTEYEEKQNLLSQELRMNIQKKINANTISHTDSIKNIFL